MGPGKPAISFRASFRLTVLLPLVLLAGCLSGEKASNSGESTSPWSTKARMPTARFGLAVGVANVKGKPILYAIGGTKDGVNGLNTVEAYDPTTNTWSTKTHMPTARSGLAVGIVNENGQDILYAIGGSDGFTPLATVEAYDPITDSWTTKAPMSTPRYGLGVGVITDMIYAVGGVIGTNPPVEVYDHVGNTWTPFATSSGRELLGVGVVNDIIYAVGGSTDGTNNLSTLETYDPVTDSWTTETPMPTPRGGLGVGVINGIFYAVGGQLGDIQPKDPAPRAFESYSPLTNKWDSEPSMPTGRTLLAAGVINGTLYAVGGDDQGTVEAFTP